MDDGLCARRARGWTAGAGTHRDPVLVSPVARAPLHCARGKPASLLRRGGAPSVRLLDISQPRAGPGHQADSHLHTYSQIDLDSTGRLPKSTVLTALSTNAQASAPAGKYTYDQVRETLKTVSIDSSGQVELDDFVDLVDKLRSGAGATAGQVHRGGALSGLMGASAGAGAGAGAGGPAAAAGGASGGGGKVLVKGSNTNITHSINEDERTEFTRHINQVRPLSLNLPSLIESRRC